ncbi:AAEL017494-PA [Aedes aegypti]|uniref:AAEL017494-PA n=1 Tax=Aedes aegypti TaxID=7159 RepID=J9HTM3_AEDAE|nr:AAEL017494-PA [Aedes aegypti]
MNACLPVRRKNLAAKRVLVFEVFSSLSATQPCPRAPPQSAASADLQSRQADVIHRGSRLRTDLSRGGKSRVECVTSSFIQLKI